MRLLVKAKINSFPAVVRIAFLAGLTLILVGCAPDEEEPVDSQSEPVEVNAGEDVKVVGLGNIQLNGEGNGNSLTYLWQQIAGESVSLSSNNTPSVSFTAPRNDQTLSFKLTVTDSAGSTAEDIVDAVVDNQLIVAPTIKNKLPYVATDQGSYDVDADCTTFEPNWHHPDWAGLQRYEFNAGPIAIILGANYTNINAEDAARLTALQTDTVMQQNLINNLIELRRILTEEFKVKISNIVGNNDGLCYRTNMYVSGTEAKPGDIIPSSGGGTSGWGDKIPYMRVPYAEVLALTVAGASQQRVISHEFLHAQQWDIVRGYQEGWWWYVESYANFFGTAMMEHPEAIGQFHFARHWALDSSMTRYGVWPFWLFLADRFGYEFTADILQRTAYPDETLFQFITRIAPFDCPIVDTICRAQAVGRLYADFANTTVNYVLYINSMGGVDNRVIATDPVWSRSDVLLDKVGDNRYRIPDRLAPQRFAHNIIRLVPDPESDWLSITLDGWEVPERKARWYATIVATLDESTVPPIEAYSEMLMSGTQHINLRDWETELGATIKRLDIVVATVPEEPKVDQLLPQFNGPFRFQALDRFVYELSIKGGWPKGHEPHTLRDQPEVAGDDHPNGGGFVASTANVADTVYVGPEARVLENAQITDNARIVGRSVIAGNSMVSGNAIISSSAQMSGSSKAESFATVRDTIILRDQVSIGGDGKVQGDGVFWGSFVVAGKAFVGGTHLPETTGGTTINGTAISNGHTWLDGGATISQGGPYDYWTTDGQGLFLSYDFSTQHAYRVKDNYVDSDAYYLDLNGISKGSLPIVQDSTVSGSVLEMKGSGYLELPRLLLDQRSYSLKWRFSWQGGPQLKQYLFDAGTRLGEQLSVIVNPVESDKYEIQLVHKDREGVESSAVLQGDILVSDNWLDMGLSYDDTTKKLLLSAKPITSGIALESPLTLPYGTREFDYDTLRIHMGSSVNKNASLYGRLDDISLYR